MLRASRFLPLITVVTWILTLFIPVLDSRTEIGPGIRITSLGGDVLALDELETPFLVVWVVLVIAAILGLLLRGRMVWSVAVMLFAAVVTAGLIGLVMDPPLLMWDGVDDQGRPTGGMEVAEPALGALLWLVGLACLFAAGVCGLLGTDRSTRDR